MAGQSVTIEKIKDAGVLTIDNPPVNALSEEVFNALKLALEQASEDKEVKFIVLTGQGEKVFASGADLHELEAMDSGKAVEKLTRIKEICGKIIDFPKPTIAAVNGHAFGGGLELSLYCDFRVADENIKLGLPEIKLGVMPASGGTQLLPGLIGMARARWWLLSGDPLSAREAADLGLIDRVVGTNALLDTAVEMGKKLSSNGPLAYQAIKKALRVRLEMPFSAAMHEETRLFGELCDSQDKAEGVKAFLEKRAPKFVGQ